MIERQSQNAMRRIRARLHAANPHCHWCNGLTVLGGGLTNPDTATVDHLKPRRECKSQEQYESAANHVLACLECNQQRDRVDYALMEHQKKQQEIIERLKVKTRRTLVRPRYLG